LHVADGVELGAGAAPVGVRRALPAIGMLLQ
jgi:hypothetical protein